MALGAPSSSTSGHHHKFAPSHRLRTHPHSHKPRPEAPTHSLTHYSKSPASKTMATQRIISGEKTILEKDDIVGASPAAGTQSNIAPAVPTYVLCPVSHFPLDLSPTITTGRKAGGLRGSGFMLAGISLLTLTRPHQGRHRQAAGLHLRHDRRAHRLVLCDGQHGIQR